jgi:hypothetical protein
LAYKEKEIERSIQMKSQKVTSWTEWLLFPLAAEALPAPPLAVSAEAPVGTTIGEALGA